MMTCWLRNETFSRIYYIWFRNKSLCHEFVVLHYISTCASVLLFCAKRASVLLFCAKCASVLLFWVKCASVLLFCVKCASVLLFCVKCVSVLLFCVKCASVLLFWYSLDYLLHAFNIRNFNSLFDSFYFQMEGSCFCTRDKFMNQLIM